MRKCRIDQLLVSKGLTADLKSAQSIIMQGLVSTHNKLLNKPGVMVDYQENLFIKQRKEHRYVSRAALKLEAALDHFNIPIKEQVALDIGCATGGFTEVLLNRGAKLVFAVDVAYGEFSYSLRSNSKVVLLERTNARFLTPKQIYIPPNIIVCDASFISLISILPASFDLAGKNFKLVALIKPQFEALKSEVDKGKGIVTDFTIHSKICAKIKNWLIELDFNVIGILPSPIKGIKGNQEYLICAVKNG